MVFSSLTFLLLFLPLTLLLYFLSGNLRWRNGVLLLASLLFYAWGEPVFILIMLVTVTVNYAAALVIARAHGKSIRVTALVLGVIASVAFLAWFKYAAFLVNSLCGLFGAGYTMAAKKLPIGISFYTFQVLTYTVDVYRGKAAVQKNYARLLLYVSCFPQLIAGPIVQYADVEAQMAERCVTREDFSGGMARFVAGLGKKVLLANVCGSALDSLTLAGTGALLSVAGAWLAAGAYSLQLYFDFSAYSDMAIGIGRMLGFTYKENFNYPYISTSITEFWRRWHISLGAFFRDYVYIPMGGNRVSTGRHIINLLVVWGLTGLWHGASWNFLLWGLYYGVLLIAEKYLLKGLLQKLPRPLRWLPCLVLVICGWVIFYYEDMAAVRQHLEAMFGIGVSGLSDAVTAEVFLKKLWFWPVALLACTPVVPWLKKQGDRAVFVARAEELLALPVLTVILAVSVLFIVGQSYNPFLYFRF